MRYRQDETDFEITLTPQVPAVASVILLHGLGADGHDFVPIAGELGLPDSLPVRFVFPHAPMRPVTVNNGYVMRAWYDIKSFTPAGRVLPGWRGRVVRGLTQSRSPCRHPGHVVLSALSGDARSGEVGRERWRADPAVPWPRWLRQRLPAAARA